MDGRGARANETDEQTADRRTDERMNTTKNEKHEDGRTDEQNGQTETNEGTDRQTHAHTNEKGRDYQQSK